MRPPSDGGPGTPPEHDEERRYRDTLELDPALSASAALLLERLGDPSWRVRRAAAERLARGEPSAVVRQLVSALGAGSGPGLRTAAGEALVLIGAPALGALSEALESALPEVRTAAAEILGDLGSRRAAPALVARLGDRDPNTRVAAAGALGKLGGEEALAGLRSALDTSDGDLGRAALDACLRLRAAVPAERLEALAADRRQRRPALRLAGMSDEPVALRLLASGLEDPSRGVREAALAGVGYHRMRHGHRHDVLAAAVREAAARTPELPAHAAAALAAGEQTVRSGALAVLAWVGQAPHVPAIVASAEDDRLRSMAAEALAAIGPPAGPVLHELLTGLAPVPKVVAAAALARLGDRAAFDALAEALSGEDEAARDLAIEALGRVGDRRAVAALVPLLANDDPGVSGAAVAALAELSGHEDVRPAVLLVCRDVSVPARPALLRLVGRVGEAEDVPALRAALRAPHRGTRVAAAGALSAIASRVPLEPWPLPELEEALEDPDDAVRAAAVQAFGLIAAGGAAGRERGESVQGLAMALGDESAAVRAEAALALGRCGALAHREALAELVRDAALSPEPAAAALHALADLGAATDPGLLEGAARQADPEVVKEAVRAAALVPGSSTTAILLAAGRHARWDVRRAAARALGARGDPALLAIVRDLARVEEDPLVLEELAAAGRALGGRA
ncbi:MAG TPA: HEAT repeat domain-containing protein [Anaeromyxobacteraceae bacterium]|nr:HEAT repeat domain-containing protein [Anaeromyxobacteraceae bacterium]